jgi:hypothetical protein
MQDISSDVFYKEIRKMKFRYRLYKGILKKSSILCYILWI